MPGVTDLTVDPLGKPVSVKVHSGVGPGNEMDNILTVSWNETALIIIAGQQTRQMLSMEPFLTIIDATQLPKRWVKWGCQRARVSNTRGASCDPGQAPAVMRAGMAAVLGQYIHRDRAGIRAEVIDHRHAGIEFALQDLLRCQAFDRHDQ